ncbi:MAG: hypothetical protein COX77_04270 [Candidatus Komeilibacteria bacterium CG_4_10_14_0_2_um_filter_37_10]|uniref:Galactose-1-phosphate uridyl transferase N-terminal domain-containing protein n=1 Tax=Candidatus Komeilibacteria bacterium CG_4_10_14_0_2_um_filter_37_10 TaxID=1974470 RepID=A0A2M7VDK1_9BACT|nr:MAG: hypothetical protein COX77_04270 [Candidatus Komeilibacteria bacterium CG_4_10_14_0_2_um_filter_37_10]
MLKSEIRKDYILNRYVIITPSRVNRPRDVRAENQSKRISSCVFCPSNIVTAEVTDYLLGAVKKQWSCWSVINKYPAVSTNNKSAYGYQEVIVETPQHGIDLGELSEQQMRNVLTLYQKRTKQVSKIKKIDYILIFKNSGGKAGASLMHAHSQLLAMELLPPDVAEELYLADKASRLCGRSIYRKIIDDELKQGARIIYQDDQVVAFAPYASQFHYEAWIFTRRQVDNIMEINSQEMDSMVYCLHLILSKLHSLNLNYNFFFHQVISNQKQHFYIKIQPRDSIWAGVELGSGLVINSVAPEQAAEFYRS